VKRISVNEALKAKLPHKKLLVHGEEEYLSRQLIKKLSNSLSFEKFYPENLKDFLNFSQTSLFGGESTPLLLHAEELPSLLRKKALREAFLAKLDSLSSFLIVAFSKLEGQLLKEIEKRCEAVVESEPYSEKRAIGLILKKFKSAGREISPSLAKLIVELVGTDLTNLKSETDKLLSYPGELSEESVRELLFSSGKISPFEVLMPLLEGKSALFLERVEKALSSGIEPIQLISVLQSQVRAMVEIASSRRPRLPRDVYLRYREIASSLGLKKLLALLKTLNEREFFLKMGVESGKEPFLKLIVEEDLWKG